jgi:hypothetical protein
VLFSGHSVLRNAGRLFRVIGLVLIAALFAVQVRRDIVAQPVRRQAGAAVIG